jgi:hypothetical protein
MLGGTDNCTEFGQMPPEYSNDELDAAFKRFGKRLKAQEAKQDPARTSELKARVEELARRAPQKAKLFAASSEKLDQLQTDFEIIIQPPKTLPELIVFLLAHDKIHGKSTLTTAAVDLFTRIHKESSFSHISIKDFQKALKQLTKSKVLDLKETDDTLIIRLHQEFLSDDEVAILDLAARKGGSISIEQAMVSTQWPQARVRTALDTLTSKKIVTVKSSYTRGTQYRVKNPR